MSSKCSWWVLALGMGIFLAGSSAPALALDHVVRSGETLSRIASRYDTTVAEIKALNGLAPGRAGDLIQIGQRLKIPDDGLSGGPITSSVANSIRTYTVIRGDYLSLIANRFGTSVDWLKRTNGLTSNLIHPGDVLRVPGASVPTTIVASTTAGTTNRIRHAMNVSAAEVEVLARIIKGEVPGNAPYEGAVAVGAVVLNRVRSRYFPNTLTRVAHQREQFSCYNSNVRNRLYWGSIPDYAWRAAREALAGADPVDGATYYFNPHLVRPRWARNLSFVVRIGKRRTTAHDFYKRPGETLPRRSVGLAGSLN